MLDAVVLLDCGCGTEQLASIKASNGPWSHTVPLHCSERNDYRYYTACSDLRRRGFCLCGPDGAHRGRGGHDWSFGAVLGAIAPKTKITPSERAQFAP